MDEKKLRKAAVLVSNLDRDTAAQILRQLRPSQAARVRMAADQLPEVSEIERQTVLKEFLQKGTAAPSDVPVGVELDGSLVQKLQKAVSDESAISGEKQKVVASVAEDEFEVLHHADGAALAPLLAGEHPQTIAVVLSRLPVDSAAEVLLRLHPQLQATVAKRLLDLDETDVEILQEIEKELETTLQKSLRSARRRHAGVQALQKIIHAAPAVDQDRLISNFKKFDLSLNDTPDADGDKPSAAEHFHVSSSHPKSGKPGFSLDLSALEPSGPSEAPQPGTERIRHWEFSQVTELADDALYRVLKEIGPEVARLALIGANQSFIDRVLSQLPHSKAERLQQQLIEIPPTHLRDVELAQKQMASVAAHVSQSAV